MYVNYLGDLCDGLLEFLLHLRIDQFLDFLLLHITGVILNAGGIRTIMVQPFGGILPDQLRDRCARRGDGHRRRGRRRGSGGSGGLLLLAKRGARSLRRERPSLSELHGMATCIPRRCLLRTQRRRGCRRRSHRSPSADGRGRRGLRRRYGQRRGERRGERGRVGVVEVARRLGRFVVRRGVRGGKIRGRGGGGCGLLDDLVVDDEGGLGAAAAGHAVDVRDVLGQFRQDHDFVLSESLQYEIKTNQ